MARLSVGCGVFGCRYNRLLTVIINSLRDLLKALKGLVVMSQQLEEMANSLFVNQVPGMWAGKVRLSTDHCVMGSSIRDTGALTDSLTH